jgi:hypothetical protein
MTGRTMTHPSSRSDFHEEWAIAYLQKVVDLSVLERDALPGSVVSHVKDAIIIMKKRRGGTRKSARPGEVQKGRG